MKARRTTALSLIVLLLASTLPLPALAQEQHQPPKNYAKDALTQADYANPGAYPAILSNPSFNPAAMPPAQLTQHLPQVPADKMPLLSADQLRSLGADITALTPAQRLQLRPDQLIPDVLSNIGDLGTLDPSAVKTALQQHHGIRAELVITPGAQIRYVLKEGKAYLVNNLFSAGGLDLASIGSTVALISPLTTGETGPDAKEGFLLVPFNKDGKPIYIVGNNVFENLAMLPDGSAQLTAADGKTLTVHGGEVGSTIIANGILMTVEKGGRLSIPGLQTSIEALGAIEVQYVKERGTERLRIGAAVNDEKRPAHVSAPGFEGDIHVGYLDVFKQGDITTYDAQGAVDAVFTDTSQNPPTVDRAHGEWTARVRGTSPLSYTAGGISNHVDVHGIGRVGGTLDKATYSLQTNKGRELLGADPAAISAIRRLKEGLATVKNDIDRQLTADPDAKPLLRVPEQDASGRITFKEHTCTATGCTSGGETTTLENLFNDRLKASTLDAYENSLVTRTREEGANVMWLSRDYDATTNDYTSGDAAGVGIGRVENRDTGLLFESRSGGSSFAYRSIPAASNDQTARAFYAGSINAEDNDFLTLRQGLSVKRQDGAQVHVVDRDGRQDMMLKMPDGSWRIVERTRLPDGSTITDERTLDASDTNLISNARLLGETVTFSNDIVDGKTRHGAIVSADDVLARHLTNKEDGRLADGFTFQRDVKNGIDDNIRVFYGRGRVLHVTSDTSLITAAGQNNAFGESYNAKGTNGADATLVQDLFEKLQQGRAALAKLGEGLYSTAIAELMRDERAKTARVQAMQADLQKDRTAMDAIYQKALADYRTKYGSDPAKDDAAFGELFGKTFSESLTRYAQERGVVMLTPEQMNAEVARRLSMAGYAINPDNTITMQGKRVDTGVLGYILDVQEAVPTALPPARFIADTIRDSFAPADARVPLIDAIKAQTVGDNKKAADSWRAYLQQGGNAEYGVTNTVNALSAAGDYSAARQAIGEFKARYAADIGPLGFALLSLGVDSAAAAKDPVALARLAGQVDDLAKTHTGAGDAKALAQRKAELLAQAVGAEASREGSTPQSIAAYLASAVAASQALPADRAGLLLSQMLGSARLTTYDLEQGTYADIFNALPTSQRAALAAAAREREAAGLDLKDASQLAQARTLIDEAIALRQGAGIGIPSSTYQQHSRVLAAEGDLDGARAALRRAEESFGDEAAAQEYRPDRGFDYGRYASQVNAFNDAMLAIDVRRLPLGEPDAARDLIARADLGIANSFDASAGKQNENDLRKYAIYGHRQLGDLETAAAYAAAIVRNAASAGSVPPDQRERLNGQLVEAHSTIADHDISRQRFKEARDNLKTAASIATGETRERLTRTIDRTYVEEYYAAGDAATRQTIAVAAMNDGTKSTALARAALVEATQDPSPDKLTKLKAFIDAIGGDGQAKALIGSYVAERGGTAEQRKALRDLLTQDINDAAAYGGKRPGEGATLQDNYEKALRAAWVALDLPQAPAAQGLMANLDVTLQDEENLIRAGKGDLVQRLRDARAALASGTAEARLLEAQRRSAKAGEEARELSAELKGLGYTLQPDKAQTAWLAKNRPDVLQRLQAMGNDRAIADLEEALVRLQEQTRDTDKRTSETDTRERDLRAKLLRARMNQLDLAPATDPQARLAQRRQQAELLRQALGLEMTNNRLALEKSALVEPGTGITAQESRRREAQRRDLAASDERLRAEYDLALERARGADAAVALLAGRGGPFLTTDAAKTELFDIARGLGIKDRSIIASRAPMDVHLALQSVGTLTAAGTETSAGRLAAEYDVLNSLRGELTIRRVQAWRGEKDVADARGIIWDDKEAIENAERSIRRSQEESAAYAGALRMVSGKFGDRTLAELYTGIAAAAQYEKGTSAAIARQMRQATEPAVSNLLLARAAENVKSVDTNGMDPDLARAARAQAVQTDDIFTMTTTGLLTADKTLLSERLGAGDIDAGTMSAFRRKAEFAAVRRMADNLAADAATARGFAKTQLEKSSQNYAQSAAEKAAELENVVRTTDDVQVRAGAAAALLDASQSQALNQLGSRTNVGYGDIRSLSFRLWYQSVSGGLGETASSLTSDARSAQNLAYALKAVERDGTAALTTTGADGKQTQSTAGRILQERGMLATDADGGTILDNDAFRTMKLTAVKKEDKEALTAHWSESVLTFGTAMDIVIGAGATKLMQAPALAQKISLLGRGAVVAQAAILTGVMEGSHYAIDVGAGLTGTALSGVGVIQPQAATLAQTFKVERIGSLEGVTTALRDLGTGLISNTISFGVTNAGERLFTGIGNAINSVTKGQAIGAVGRELSEEAVQTAGTMAWDVGRQATEGQRLDADTLAQMAFDNAVSSAVFLAGTKGMPRLEVAIDSIRARAGITPQTTAQRLALSVTEAENAQTQRDAFVRTHLEGLGVTASSDPALNRLQLERRLNDPAIDVGTRSQLLGQLDTYDGQIQARQLMADALRASQEAQAIRTQALAASVPDAQALRQADQAEFDAAQRVLDARVALGEITIDDHTRLSDGLARAMDTRNAALETAARTASFFANPERYTRDGALTPEGSDFVQTLIAQKKALASATAADAGPFSEQRAGILATEADLFERRTRAMAEGPLSAEAARGFEAERQALLARKTALDDRVTAHNGRLGDTALDQRLPMTEFTVDILRNQADALVARRVESEKALDTLAQDPASSASREIISDAETGLRTQLAAEGRTRADIDALIERTDEVSLAARTHRQKLFSMLFAETRLQDAADSLRSDAPRVTKAPPEAFIDIDAPALSMIERFASGSAEAVADIFRRTIPVPCGSPCNTCEATVTGLSRAKAALEAARIPRVENLMQDRVAAAASSYVAAGSSPTARRLVQRVEQEGIVKDTRQARAAIERYDATAQEAGLAGATPQTTADLARDRALAEKLFERSAQGIAADPAAVAQEPAVLQRALDLQESFRRFPEEAAAAPTLTARLKATLGLDPARPVLEQAARPVTPDMPLIENPLAAMLGLNNEATEQTLINAIERARQEQQAAHAADQESAAPDPTLLLALNAPALNALRPGLKAVIEAPAATRLEDYMAAKDAILDDARGQPDAMKKARTELRTTALAISANDPFMTGELLSAIDFTIMRNAISDNGLRGQIEVYDVGSPTTSLYSDTDAIILQTDAWTTDSFAKLDSMNRFLAAAGMRPETTPKLATGPAGSMPRERLDQMAALLSNPDQTNLRHKILFARDIDGGEALADLKQAILAHEGSFDVERGAFRQQHDATFGTPPSTRGEITTFLANLPLAGAFDIKQDPGGTRSIQQVQWMLATKLGRGDLGSPAGVREVYSQAVKAGIITDADARSLVAADTFWRNARNANHYKSGRELDVFNEQLAQDIAGVQGSTADDVAAEARGHRNAVLDVGLRVAAGITTPVAAPATALTADAIRQAVNC